MNYGHKTRVIAYRSHMRASSLNSASSVLIALEVELIWALKANKAACVTTSSIKRHVILECLFLDADWHYFSGYGRKDTFVAVEIQNSPRDKSALPDAPALQMQPVVVARNVELMENTTIIQRRVFFGC